MNYVVSSSTNDDDCSPAADIFSADFVFLFRLFIKQNKNKFSINILL